MTLDACASTDSTDIKAARSAARAPRKGHPGATAGRRGASRAAASPPNDESMDPKRSAPVEWSPSASERQLSPYEYLQFIQRKAVSENAVVSQGIMTRFQSFHLYWKTPCEQQLADYDIELARHRRP